VKIGVLGIGQLGMMVALAAHPMGHRIRFLAPTEAESTSGLGELVLAEYDDVDALRRFADGLDVVTYEFENVDLEALKKLSSKVPVHPSIEALSTSRDRLLEKNFFRELGAKTPQYREVNSLDELNHAVKELGYPTVLKTRRFGYDGKGQSVIRLPEDCAKAWKSTGDADGGLILEEFVSFERELSLISVRSSTGETATYPLIENHHVNGILAKSIAPAPDVSEKLQNAAQHIAEQTMNRLDYAGVLTIEFFHVGDELWVNEMAPRVHNSGHWTIEGAVTSQFENHIRAVCGLPLGSTQLLGHSTMFNLVGKIPKARKVLEVPGAHLHNYSKAPRPGRKIGHITVTQKMDEDSRSCQRVSKLLERD